MTDGPRSGRQRPRLTATVTDVEVVRQRAYLVGVVTRDREASASDGSLDELGLLTETAGSEPVEATLVRRDRPDAALFIGKGKAAEIASSTKALDIDVVVFDNELTPAQQRNLQNLFECDVVDRVAVILDIFAQHASSREGMLQVELAQHRYRLPRLRGRGIEMSRLGAGINTRGPGETQLETDRRRILDRVRKLESELQELGRGRETRSKARRRSKLSLVSLVGYTNAGKSTLFNLLTGADVLVEDQLFATLDSTVRKVHMPGGHEILVSDTVGFVRRLPHQLVEAFRSTLEQVNEADLMVHVVDASDPDPDQQITAVRTVLSEIGAADLPELIVVNKIDAADPAAVDRLLALYPGAVAVSALTGEGRHRLEDAIFDRLAVGKVELDLLFPYDSGDALATLHRVGEVTKTVHEDRGTLVHAKIPQHAAHRFSDFAIHG
jgi:GTP-binding protein HflX